MTARAVSAIFVLAIVAMAASGCTRTVVGTYRSESPGYKFRLAIRTAGPLGKPYAGENQKDVRVAFFICNPEKSAGGATITVKATDPHFQVQWEGDERVTVDIVESDSVKGTRTLATAVFVFDRKREHFKKQ